MKIKHAAILQMQPPPPLSIQEIADELQMLTYEMNRLYESTDVDHGSHQEACLESIRLARLHAEAAIRQYQKHAQMEFVR